MCTKVNRGIKSNIDAYIIGSMPYLHIDTMPSWSTVSVHGTLWTCQPALQTLHPRFVFVPGPLFAMHEEGPAGTGVQFHVAHLPIQQDIIVGTCTRGGRPPGFLGAESDRPRQGLQTPKLLWVTRLAPQQT